MYGKICVILSFMMSTPPEAFSIGGGGEINFNLLYILIKLCSLKDAIKRMKRPVTDWN